MQDPVFSLTVYIVTIVVLVVARRSRAPAKPTRQTPPESLRSPVLWTPTPTLPTATVVTETREAPRAATTIVRVGRREIVVESSRLSPRD